MKAADDTAAFMRQMGAPPPAGTFVSRTPDGQLRVFPRLPPQPEGRDTTAETAADPGDGEARAPLRAPPETVQIVIGNLAGATARWGASRTRFEVVNRRTVLGNPFDMLKTDRLATLEGEPVGVKKKKKTKLTKRGKGKSHEERRQEAEKERNDGAPQRAAGKGRAT